MAALIIAIGNPLRRDDGVALHMLKLLKVPQGVTTYKAQQLTPELAMEICVFDLVIFADADMVAERVVIEQVDVPPPDCPLTHVTRPQDVVALSRVLFSFTGEAFVCRIPVIDLSQGESLSSYARNSAVNATREIEAFLAVRVGNGVAVPVSEQGTPKRRRARP